MTDDSPATHCEDCGGPFTRPGEFACEDDRHRSPDLAERMVWIVEHELNDRRGLHWSGLDESTLFELRDDLARKVRDELIREGIRED